MRALKPHMLRYFTTLLVVMLTFVLLNIGLFTFTEAKATGVAPACTLLNNPNPNTPSYKNMYLDNDYYNDEEPTARHIETSASLVEAGNSDNTGLTPVDPDARYFEATFNPFPADRVTGAWTSKPYFNIFVSKGWYLEPVAFFDLFSGFSGLSDIPSAKIVDNKGLVIEPSVICPQGNCDANRHIVDATYPDGTKFINPLIYNSPDPEYFDGAVATNRTSEFVKALNTTGIWVGSEHDEWFEVNGDKTDKRELFFEARNFRWSNFADGWGKVEAAMEDGSNPAAFDFKLPSGGNQRGFFGNPDTGYRFIQNLEKTVGSSFSVRYHTEGALGNKGVKIRFAVKKDPNYTGPEVPFYAAAWYKTYDKSKEYHRAVFKFESQEPDRHYPLKVVENVYASEKDRNNGTLKTGAYGPPAHKFDIRVTPGVNTGDYDVNYPLNNPLSLCYVYKTKTKLSERIDPFSIRIKDANGQNVALNPIPDKNNPKNVSYWGEYPMPDGTKKKFYLVPELNYETNSSSGEPRFNGYSNLSPRLSTWRVDWIDPSERKFDYFNLKVPDNQRVVAPGTTINPEIQAIDTGGFTMPGVNTIFSVKNPDGTDRQPFSGGLVTGKEGYLWDPNNSNAKAPIAGSTNQAMGRYAITVPKYDPKGGTSFVDTTDGQVRPKVDYYLVTDKDKNIVADHDLTFYKSKYQWMVDKSVWVESGDGNKGQWVSVKDLYRDGGKVGTKDKNTSNRAFPYKYRLRIAAVEKFSILDGKSPRTVARGVARIQYQPKPGAPQSITLSDITVSVPGYGDSECVAESTSGMVLRSFQTVNVNYTCSFAGATDAPIKPKISLGAGYENVGVYDYKGEYKDGGEPASSKIGTVTVRDAYSDSTLPTDPTLVDLRDAGYKGTWCSYATNNASSCADPNKITSLDSSFSRSTAGIGDTNADNDARAAVAGAVLEQMVNGKPIVNRDLLMGLTFDRTKNSNRNQIENKFKRSTGDRYLTIDRNLGYMSNPDGYNSTAGREIYYFYEIPKSNWQDKDQVLNNTARACYEDTAGFNGSFNGLNATPDNFAVNNVCEEAAGQSTSKTTLRIKNGFEKVMVRVAKATSDGTILPNNRSSSGDDYQAMATGKCTNSPLVIAQKPNMLSQIAELTPGTTPDPANKLCLLPSTGNSKTYSRYQIASDGTTQEIGFKPGKYEVSEFFAPNTYQELPEALEFEIDADQNFHFLDKAGRWIDTERDGVAWVEPARDPDPSKPKPKAYVVNMIDPAKPVLPASGGAGVWLPSLLGFALVVGYALFRRRHNKD